MNSHSKLHHVQNLHKSATKGGMNLVQIQQSADHVRQNNVKTKQKKNIHSKQHYTQLNS